jgi:lipopolysaccharide heptosyltransferase II
LETRTQQSTETSRIDWSKVNRVLVIRLRSIGDTVLCTPSLIALRRFLPHARIDILLEGWVAPLLDGFDGVDEVLIAGTDLASRLQTARKIRRNKYDVVFNQHGGTTATFFARASGARDLVGFAGYQYSFLYNHRIPPASEFWAQEKAHSAEQQLALAGSVGVPVDDRPKSRLAVTLDATSSLEKKLTAETRRRGVKLEKFALFHPAAAFETKQWAAENFARVAEFLSEKGLGAVAVASPNEGAVLDALVRSSGVPVLTFDDLTLPEIAALASKATVFVGNDSGIAHIAAAVGTPTVVIFGSSNIAHWRPWTDAPNEVVYEKLACQPCAGYTCEVYGKPKCILSVEPERVFEAIKNVLVPAKGLKN